ncbi:MAG: ApaLI family restriction endonuclease [Candidatus Pacebacteria bacterium]|jgi:hypothetical protein|nr:ApaLI family restriction endonuclease [Candidatus Paceibacterota bacterium]
MKTIDEKILDLSERYTKTLRQKMTERITEMESDDNSHYLLYRVLGIATAEGKLIDEYQNMGRFLYKYAGSFLEEAAILCFEEKFSKAERKVRIPNTLGSKPVTFEIDCLVGKDAYEIKWRDATTDGDHITKEHTRVKNIKNAGYKPIRIMFYYPNRAQAIRIQETLKTIYAGVGGDYYFGDSAWKIIKKQTGVDLLAILEKIADKKTKSK